LVNEQLALNEQIQELIIPNLSFQGEKVVLNLRKKNLKDLEFLAKFAREYRILKVLDLSENSLGDNCAK